ncbi:MAG: TRAP transporter small permease [Burkholderiaceae bacterium]|jgi:C4-dicarboxylate transporter DctQ subunit
MNKSISLLQRIDRDLEKWALLWFYTMLVVTMAIEVLRREVFSYSSIWGEEIVRYAFIYLVWIGAAAAVRERAHIRIDILFEFCSQRIRALLYLFGDLVMVVVAVFALILSFESLLVSLKFGSVSHGLRLPMSLFLCAVPIGFVLMLFRLAQSIRRDLRNIKNNDATYEGGRLFD